MNQAAKTAIKMIVTMFVGLLPGAPGTYGSALTAVLAAAWLYWGGWALTGQWYFVVVLVLAVFALWSTRMALRARIFGDDGDPSPVVVDEAVGMAISMYGIAALDWHLFAAFVAFRFFDILKPFPVGISQRLPGEWGVVIDDMLAGVYAYCAVWLMEYGYTAWAANFPAY